MGASRQRLDRPIGITVLTDMMARNTWPESLFAPAILRLVDPSKASLILEHQADTLLIVENFQFFDASVNFFEVSMTSSLAFFGCLLRGITFLHP